MTKQDKATLLISLKELKEEVIKDLAAVDRVIGLVNDYKVEPVVEKRCTICGSNNINFALDQCNNCKALYMSNGEWLKKEDQASGLVSMYKKADHKFVKHETYTGHGCAQCGSPLELHPV